jgi:hypothetical protein
MSQPNLKSCEKQSFTRILICSAHQKFWPVVHKLNEKTYQIVSKFYILIDIHKGHKKILYLVIPPPYK